MNVLKKFLLTSCLAAATSLSAPSFAASISFVEQVGGNVSVTHDAYDWQTFSSGSTAETAWVDATLFKFSGQGSAGVGTQVFFLTDPGNVISDILVAAVTAVSDYSYTMHFDFYSTGALPVTTPHSTGNYQDIFIAGEYTYIGLNTFPIGIEISSLPESVPEPGTMILAGLGLLGMAATRRKRHAQ